MALEKQVQVKFLNRIDHRFFDYVTAEEKQEIVDRFNRGISQMVFFLVNGEEKFAAVIDYHIDCIHVRECGGSFPFMWRYLKEFCDALAKTVGVNIVTFKTYIAAVKYLAKKAGFALNADGDFERIVTA